MVCLRCLALCLCCIFKPALSQVPDSEITIGEVARRAGVRPSAIRYYESIGVLPPAPRVSGQRRFSSDVLRTLAVIRSGQWAGLDLGEIRELLSGAEDGAVSERLRAIAERKLPHVQALVERSLLVEGWLRAAAQCRCPTLARCPLFDHRAGGALPS
jgi:MerR family transcriptional regulator, redox-sensitive transcriptional activator SoxR